MNAIEIMVLPPPTRGLCLTKHECYGNNTATFHQRSLKVTCVHIWGHVYMLEGGYIYICTYMSVADPGFPIGGHGSIRGGMDLQHGCFLMKMYAKTKRIGSCRGVCAWHAPPRSANACVMCKV